MYKLYLVIGNNRKYTTQIKNFIPKHFLLPLVVPEFLIIMKGEPKQALIAIADFCKTMYQ